jgi:hypothetical protein
LQEPRESCSGKGWIQAKIVQNWWEKQENLQKPRVEKKKKFYKSWNPDWATKSSIKYCMATASESNLLEGGVENSEKLFGRGIKEFKWNAEKVIGEGLARR